MGSLDTNDPDGNMPGNKNGTGHSQSRNTELQTQRLAIWLAFLGKMIWPALLLTALGLFHPKVDALFDRLTSLTLAGQVFSFAEDLKEPMAKHDSIYRTTEIYDVADRTIDVHDHATRRNALFQECKKYIVLHTNDIPRDDVAEAEQMFQIIEVIRASIVCGSFVGLIVLDDEDRYVGSFDRDFFLETIIPRRHLVGYPLGKLPPDQARWMESNTIFAAALAYPERRIDSGDGFRIKVRQDQSVSETLGVLSKRGKDFAVVVDSRGRFQGAVTRTDLVNRVLQALTAS